MRKNIIIYSILAISILSIGYLSWVIFKRALSNTESVKESAVVQEDSEKQETPLLQEEVSATIKYDEKAVDENSKYFEKYTIINNEQAYIAYPLEIESKNPPRLIIYSHGTNGIITTDTKNQIMRDMRSYGRYFTQNGFAYAAINIDGANWENNISVSNIKGLILWFDGKYKIKNTVNLLSHSKGSLPNLYFSFKYPHRVNIIALLAPTARPFTKEQFKNIKHIPIQIWHGDEDVNIPLYKTINLKSSYESYGFTNMKLEILPGKTHWDVDTELKKDILNFYLKYE